MRNILLFIFVALGYESFGQTILPYFTGFDNANQQAGWQAFRKGDVSNGSWGFSSGQGYSAPNALYHNYPVGGAVPTIDWFSSPPFNFSNGGKIDSIRHNYSGFGTPFSGDTLALYLLTGSADPSLSTSKILLHDFTINYSNDGLWHLDTGIVIPSTAGQSYIAFKYVTTVNWLDVHFDNLSISGKTASGITTAPTVNTLSISPNPTYSKSVVICQQSFVNATVKLINIKGQTIMEKQNQSGNQFSIDLTSQPQGIYFVEVQQQSNVWRGKVVKE